MAIPLEDRSELRRYIDKEPGLCAFGLSNLAGWHQIATGRTNDIGVASDIFSAMDTVSTALVVKDRFVALIDAVSVDKVRDLAAEIGNLAYQVFAAVQFFVQTRVVQIGEWGKSLSFVGNMGQIAYATNSLYNNSCKDSVAADFLVDGTKLALSCYSLSGGANPVVIQALLTALWASFTYSYHVHQT